jgi:hypothetical protein
LVVLGICWPAIVCGQQHKKASTTTPAGDLQTFLEVTQLQSSHLNLAVVPQQAADNSGAHSRTFNAVLNDLVAATLARPPIDPKLAAQHILLRTYYSGVGNVFNSLTSLSREHNIRCIYPKGTIPVAFYSTKDGRGVAVLGIALERTYNTLRLDAKRRAVEAFQSAALPTLEKLARGLSTSGFDEVGAVVLYSSKNFLRDEDSPTPEMLSISSPKNLIRDFMAGKITVQDVMGGVEAYSVNGNLVGPRKVSLN